MKQVDKLLFDNDEAFQAQGFSTAKDTYSLSNVQFTFQDTSIKNISPCNSYSNKITFFEGTT